MYSYKLISTTCILELSETQIYSLVCPIYDISAFADDLLFFANFLGVFSTTLLFGFIFAESLILFDLIFDKKTSDSSEASKPAGNLPEPPSNVPPVAELGEDSPSETPANVPPTELGEDSPVETPANVPPTELGEDSPVETPANVPPTELLEDKPLVATPDPEGPRAVEKPRGRTYYGRQAKIPKTAPDVSLRKVLFPPGT
jgi:hypothetical protein